jgi:protein tyrosine phosphatase (PTP) superfamily phosphohydrolase (DUF442 family)
MDRPLQHTPHRPTYLPQALALLCASLLCTQTYANQAAATPPAPPKDQAAPTQTLAKPCDDCVPGVINFAKVSEALWRGAQPNAQGFKAMEAMGLKTVINLRHNHDDLPLLKDTKLKYLQIPSLAFHPTTDNLVAFLKVMENPENWPVFIHCAQGRDRTGYNAASYRMFTQKWGTTDSILEMNAFRFNKIWVGNPGFLKDLNMEMLAEKLKSAAKPKFVVWQD